MFNFNRLIIKKVVGVSLESSCFSYGQLHVANFKIGSPNFIQRIIKRYSLMKMNNCINVSSILTGERRLYIFNNV